MTLKNKKTSQNQALQQKSHQKNKHLSSPLIKYSGPFLKWMKEELRQMDQKNRKLMTMALNPRDDRIYMSRKD